jgi:hypothetical protein
VEEVELFMLKAEFDKKAAALLDDADAAPFLGRSVAAITIGSLRAMIDGLRPEDSFDLSSVDASVLLVFRDGEVISSRKIKQK